MHGQSSFYVDCDGFSVAADAPHRGIEMFLESEQLKSRLQVLHQLDNRSDEVIAETPFQLLKMIDIDHAAKWCAEDPRCTGLCFNEETGWARFYHTALQKGFAKLDDGTNASVCLALKGFGPPGTGMKREMRPCFRSLEETSSGSWIPSKVPKNMLLLPDGSSMQLRLFSFGARPVQISFEQGAACALTQTAKMQNARTPSNDFAHFL